LDAESLLERVDLSMQLSPFSRDFRLPRPQRLGRGVAEVDLLVQATPFRRHAGLCGFESSKLLPEIICVAVRHGASIDRSISSADLGSGLKGRDGCTL